MHRILLTCAVALCWLVPEASVRASEPETSTTAEEPSDEVAKKRSPRITVSKEITHITEPLTDKGYVDYLAALNNRAAEGVTAENNAAVPLFQAAGPDIIEDTIRDEFFGELGIPAPATEGNHFVLFADYVKDRGLGENLPAESPPMRQFWTATDALWTKDDAPLVFEWLQANEKPLDRIAEGVRRPRWYVPLIRNAGEDGDPTIIGAAWDYLETYREMGRALVIRARLHAAQGEMQDAWQDLLAALRLARHVGKEPTVISGLVAVAIDAIALGASQDIAHSGKLTADMARRMISDLQALAPVTDMLAALDTGERFIFLDVVQLVAREGPQALGAVQGMGPVANAVAGSAIDWNVAMRMGNGYYDQMVAAARKTDPSERQEALDGWQRDLKKLRREADVGFALKSLLLGGKSLSEWMGRQMGAVFVMTLLPAAGPAVEAEVRSTARLRLTLVALALAAYQAEHGRYPDDLAALTPKYFDRLPRDPHTGGVLHYVPSEEGYLLYTVGANETDDGGRSYDAKPPGDDIIIQTPDDAQP